MINRELSNQQSGNINITGTNLQGVAFGSNNQINSGNSIINSNNNNVNSPINSNNHSSANNILEEEIATKILQAIERIEQDIPPTNGSNNFEIAETTVQELDNIPGFREKALKALDSGAMQALKSHPIGMIIVAMVKGWRQAQQI